MIHLQAEPTAAWQLLRAIDVVAGEEANCDEDEKTGLGCSSERWRLRHDSSRRTRA